MAKHPQNAFVKTRRLEHRALPSDPRYEIVFEKRSSARFVLTNVLAELKSLGGRGGSAIGGSYALAASVLLRGKERLEDLNAERRLRQRPKAHPSASNPARGAASRPTKSLPPKASV